MFNVTGCGSSVVRVFALQSGNRELEPLKPKQESQVFRIAPSPNARHLEARITGLSDMTLKTEVLSHDKC